MSIIIITLFFILIFITRKIGLTHTAKWFILSFQFIWGIVLFLTTFQPYDLYLPSVEAYTLLILNVIFFSIGFYSSRRRSKRKVKINLTLIESQIDYFSDNKVYRTILIVSCLLSIYYFSIFLTASLISDNLGELRTQFYDRELYGPYFDLINGILLNPTQIITYPLAAYGCLYRRKWILIPMMIFLICYNSLSGGRFGYVKIFYSFLFIMLCIKKLNFKRFLSIGMLGCVLFLFLSYITASRSDNEGNMYSKIESGVDETFRHITTYACGASVAFDHSLSDDYASKIGGYGYGAVTGSSIVQILYIVSNKFGLPINQPIEKLGEYKQEQYIRVGNDVSFNALYTAALYFYLDFGYLGVIVIPFFLGSLCIWLIRKFEKYQNIYFLMIINFCYILTMFSITDFNFTTYSPLVVLCLLYYLGTNRKTKEFGCKLSRL